MERILTAIALALVVVWACTETPKEKEIGVYVPSDGNLDRYPTPEAVSELLDSIASVGFNSIVLDVKPVVGYAYYESKYLEPIRHARGYDPVKRDWDYVETFMKEAGKRGIDVTLSVCTLTLGASQLGPDGPAYSDSTKNGWFCVQYLPEGLSDIRDSREEGVFCFLNPVLPEVREFVKAYVTEILEKYHPKSFSLDYCRYNNLHSDFSEASRRAFEEYIGEPVENFPEDIFTYGEHAWDIIPGKHYQKWFEWRTGVISSLVEELSDIIHSHGAKVRFWSPSWWHAVQRNSGQNWASPDAADFIAEEVARHGYDYISPDYAKTGFAKCIDEFELGAYLPHVYGMEDLESMEYAVYRAKNLLKGSGAKLIGTFAWEADMCDAMDFMYNNTEGGVTYFAVDTFVKRNLWGEARKAIERAKNK